MCPFNIGCDYYYCLGFPDSSAVKNLPATQETGTWSLGPEDPLEKEMATHSSFLACEISWTEEPGGLPDSLGYKSEPQLSN